MSERQNQPDAEHKATFQDAQRHAEQTAPHHYDEISTPLGVGSASGYLNGNPALLAIRGHSTEEIREIRHSLGLANDESMLEQGAVPESSGNHCGSTEADKAVAVSGMGGELVTDHRVAGIDPKMVLKSLEFGGNFSRAINQSGNEAEVKALWKEAYTVTANLLRDGVASGREGSYDDAIASPDIAIPEQKRVPDSEELTLRRTLSAILVENNDAIRMWLANFGKISELQAIFETLQPERQLEVIEAVAGMFSSAYFEGKKLSTEESKE